MLELIHLFAGSADPVVTFVNSEVPLRLASQVMAAISSQFEVFHQLVLSQSGIAASTINQMVTDWRASIAVAWSSEGGRQTAFSKVGGAHLLGAASPRGSRLAAEITPHSSGVPPPEISLTKSRAESAITQEVVGCIEAINS